MHPTPSELIANVRRILRDVVEPDLDSEYTRARLREIRAVLAQVDWDDAGLELAHHTAVLRALLSEFAAWIAADDDRRTYFAAHAHALSAIAGEPAATSADRYADHAGRHTRYAAVVVALVDPLTDWLRTHPDDETAAAFRRRMLDV